MNVCQIITHAIFPNRVDFDISGNDLNTKYTRADITGVLVVDEGR